MKRVSLNGYSPRVHQQITTLLSTFTAEKLPSGPSEVVWQMEVDWWIYDKRMHFQFFTNRPLSPSTFLAGSGKIIL
jgi:hypothetical protein